MAKQYVRSNRLVIDLGMNNGEDTAYYLKKQFRVIAVEANPLLVEQAQKRFAAEITQGRLTIQHVAIWNEQARLPFHISKKNSHWSSLDSNWASREGSDTDQIDVDCVPLAQLFALYGVPTFLKVDIEGMDEIVLDQLPLQAYLPAYVSVEDCRFGARYLEKLIALGYEGFKLSNQAVLDQMVDEEVNHRFTFGSSGPVGEQVPGVWHSASEIIPLYQKQVRTQNNERRSPPGVWWDIHARGPQSRSI
jgi:FkbM family methyltransferase